MRRRAKSEGETGDTPLPGLLESLLKAPRSGPLLPVPPQTAPCQRMKLDPYLMPYSIIQIGSKT